MVNCELDLINALVINATCQRLYKVYENCVIKAQYSLLLTAGGL